MTGIGRDGDLGDLGRDTVGAAGLGVSLESVQAFKSALADLRVAASNLSSAQDQALQAAQVITSWAAVGQSVIDIVGPIVTTLAVRRAAAPDTPDPGILGAVQGVLGQLDQFRSRLGGPLAGIPTA